MEGSKPKGRKSLLAECARNSGVSFTSGDVESFLVDFPRLSVNGVNNVTSAWQERRASGQGARLVMETPVNIGTTPSVKSSATNIPRRLLASSATRIPTSSSRPSNAVKGNVTVNVSRSRPPIKPKFPTSGNTGNRSKPTVGMSSLRRSISVESFSQNMPNSTGLNLITPRGRSQSPGPGSATKAKGDTAKSIKLPGSQDKQVLNSVASYIIDSLKSLQFAKEFTLKTFQHLSTKDFHSICGFLLELFVGPKGDKIDDLTYVIDSLKILGFPGVVSKSHLKTPNTPHALPTIYTLLAWLCNLAEIFMNPEEEECAGFEARMNEEFLWESYLSLFYQFYSEKAYDIEKELDRYRTNLSEFLHPDPIPNEQLVQEIQAKEAEKEQLFALKDSRQDVMQVINTQEELLAKSRKRIAELKELKQKYSNINALETEGRTLSSELKRSQASLKALNQQIATQTINPASAEKIRADTDKARKEKEMLDKLIHDLQLKVKRQQQFQNNDESRFYDLCRQFSVLELYNSAAEKWSHIFPSISANPLDPVALDVWLNETIKKLEAAQKLMENFEVVCNEKCQRLKQETEKLAIKLDALNEEHVKLSEELRTKLNEESGILEMLNQKIREAENERNALESKLFATEKAFEASKKKFEEAVVEIAKYEPYIKDMQQYSTELDNHIEVTASAIQLAQLDMESTLMALVIDARQRINAPLWELDDPNFGK